MNLFSLITGFILWQLYSYSQGSEEGIFVAAKRGNSNEKIGDMHTRWTWQRLIIGSIIIVSQVFIYPLLTTWTDVFHLYLISAALIMSFPYLHDGYYYITVNKFTAEGYSEPYPKGFYHYKDGKAKNDFTYRQRLIMAIISLLILGWVIFADFGFEYWGANMMYVDIVIAGVCLIGVFIYKINSK